MTGHTHTPPSALSRRHFFGVLGGGVALAACGGGGDSENGADAQERAAEKWFADQTVVADGTPQRTIWSLRDDEGNLADLAPEQIDYTIVTAEGDELGGGRVDRHFDGVALPYYPIVTAFNTPGVHEFRFSTTEHGRHVGFAVPEDPADNTLLWPGDQFPSVVTPTLTNDAGVTQICTRAEICPFHDTSLDTALVSGRSTVLLVSTPAFCGTTFMCGPVLEILIEEVERRAPDANIIHAEVYRDPQPDDLGELAPIIDATRVTYEPFIFLIDGDGLVSKRLDHIWDRTELGLLLDAV